MPIKVSHILHPGSLKKQNEDQVYIGENTFGVFDGASSLVPYISDQCHTGGYIASQIARSTFEENVDYKDLNEVISDIDTKIAQSMKEHNIDVSDKNNLWCTSAAVIKIKEDTLHYSQITDSIILVIYSNSKYEILGKNSNHDLPTLNMWTKLGDISFEEKRKLLTKQIKDVRNTLNVSYGVLCGDGEYKKFLHSGEISLKNISHVLLFTDGLIPPSKDVQNSSYEEFIEIYLKSGLTGCYKWLRELENADLDCTVYPRLKPHDDVGAIALDLT